MSQIPAPYYIVTIISYPNIEPYRVLHGLETAASNSSRITCMYAILYAAEAFHPMFELPTGACQLQYINVGPISMFELNCLA